VRAIEYIIRSQDSNISPRTKPNKNVCSQTKLVLQSSGRGDNVIMQEIEASRLYLRQFTPNDLDELYRIYSDTVIDLIIFLCLE
jgi:hypothetical protein